MKDAIVAVIALVAGAAVGLAVYRSVTGRRVDTAEARATRLMAEAEKEAETRVRLALGFR